MHSGIGMNPSTSSKPIPIVTALWPVISEMMKNLNVKSLYRIVDQSCITMYTYNLPKLRKTLVCVLV